MNVCVCVFRKICTSTVNQENCITLGVSAVALQLLQCFGYTGLPLCSYNLHKPCEVSIQAKGISKKVDKKCMWATLRDESVVNIFLYDDDRLL